MVFQWHTMTVWCSLWTLPIPCLHITSFYSGEVAKDSEGGFTKHLQLTDVLGYLKFGWVTFYCTVVDILTLYGHNLLLMQNPSIYNESQAVAIQSAVDAVCEPYANPRICLLQGPPGTGKTRTICGLIQAVFEVNTSPLDASLVSVLHLIKHVQNN